jgi:transcriptional antiterminator RfaH
LPTQPLPHGHTTATTSNHSVAPAEQVWLAVRCKPRSEQQAASNLIDQQFTVFSPTITQRKRRNNCWQQVTEALFPGYLFIRVNLGEQDTSVVRSTPGVLSLVRFGYQLIPVPNAVIELLQQVECQGGPAQQQRHKAGDRVEIISGPFAGISGVYQMAKGEQRAIMLVEMLGKAQPVAVDQDHLGATL